MFTFRRKIQFSDLVSGQYQPKKKDENLYRELIRFAHLCSGKTSSNDLFADLKKIVSNNIFNKNISFNKNNNEFISYLYHKDIRNHLTEDQRLYLITHLYKQGFELPSERNSLTIMDYACHMHEFGVIDFLIKNKKDKPYNIIYSSFVTKPGNNRMIMELLKEHSKNHKVSLSKMDGSRHLMLFMAMKHNNYSLALSLIDDFELQNPKIGTLNQFMELVSQKTNFPEDLLKKIESKISKPLNFTDIQLKQIFSYNHKCARYIHANQFIKKKRSIGDWARQNDCLNIPFVRKAILKETLNKKQRTTLTRNLAL